MRRMSQQAGDDQAWGEQQRQLAALTASMADIEEDLAQSLRSADDPITQAIAAEAGIPAPADFAEQVEVSVYRLRTVQRLFAEMARNFDAFHAAGGTSNPEAVAAWEESCRLTTALMPTYDDHDLGT